VADLVHRWSASIGSLWPQDRHTPRAPVRLDSIAAIPPAHTRASGWAGTTTRSQERQRCCRAAGGRYMRVIDEGFCPVRSSAQARAHGSFKPTNPPRRASRPNRQARPRRDKPQPWSRIGQSRRPASSPVTSAEAQFRHPLGLPRAAPSQPQSASPQAVPRRLRHRAARPKPVAPASGRQTLLPAAGQPQGTAPAPPRSTTATAPRRASTRHPPHHLS